MGTVHRFEERQVSNGSNLVKEVTVKKTDLAQFLSADDEKPKKRGRPKKVKLDKDGNIKEKKPPSAYNNYVK